MSGRIRSIKPEVLEDEHASALSDSAWRLWVSSWLLADDYGNARAGSKFLAAHVWQDTTKEHLMEDILNELTTAKPGADHGMLQLYSVGGQKYVHINGWEQHQRIDNKGKPRVPPPTDTYNHNVGSIPETFLDSNKSSESLVGLPLDLRPPTSDQDQRTNMSSSDVEEVFRHWQREMGCHKSKLDPKRRARINARLKQGFSVQELCDAITGAKSDNFLMGTDPECTRKGGYRGIETLLRDAAQVERLIRLKQEPKDSTNWLEVERKKAFGPAPKQDNQASLGMPEAMQAALQGILDAKCAKDV